MDNNAIVSLLGLCLRGNHLAVGEEPVAEAAERRDIRLLVLCADAPDSTRRRAERFAREGQCLLVELPATKAELGRALGRASVAMAAVTDLGLAGALASRLGQMDPARYADLAQRMELKAKRAAERKRLHEAQAKAPRSAEVRKENRRAEEPAKAPANVQKVPGRRPRPDRDAPRKAAAPVRDRSGQRRTDASPARGGKPGSGRGFAAKRGSGRGFAAKRGSAPNPYANSRPVKKGKGSFRKKES